MFDRRKKRLTRVRVRWAWPVVFIIATLALLWGSSTSPQRHDAVKSAHVDRDTTHMREASMEDEDA